MTVRRGVHFNDEWISWSPGPAIPAQVVRNFHRNLPGYGQTPLVSLDALASVIGVRAIYLKDEGNRFNLPSFKILGASWGTFRALTSRLELPLDCGLNNLKQSLVGQNLSLFAATDGNHGRAVARMGYWLDLSVSIHVPAGMHETTIELIESEGARVNISVGNYDQAVLEAQAAANQEGGILIQDFAFGDYVDIPQWIVDGYSTMMHEIDEQLGEPQATHVIAPVGVGSFAQAITSHFRREGNSTSVIGVEPDTAACLWKSLSHGQPIAIETVPTIMAGLDCGTVSLTAWPILSKGLSASLTVSDFEAHSASMYLRDHGISAGPCSGSTVATLRRLSSSDRSRLGIDSNSIIVVPCTEGARDYEIPLDVCIEDPAELTRTIKQIISASQSKGSTSGSVEEAITRYVAAWLEHRDIECQHFEPAYTRPSPVQASSDVGSSKKLVFTGSVDTICLNFDDSPLLDIFDGGRRHEAYADDAHYVTGAIKILAEGMHLLF